MSPRAACRVLPPGQSSDAYQSRRPLAHPPAATHNDGAQQNESADRGGRQRHALVVNGADDLEVAPTHIDGHPFRVVVPNLDPPNDVISAGGKLEKMIDGHNLAVDV